MFKKFFEFVETVVPQEKPQYLIRENEPKFLKPKQQVDEDGKAESLEKNNSLQISPTVRQMLKSSREILKKSSEDKSSSNSESKEEIEETPINQELKFLDELNADLSLNEIADKLPDADLNEVQQEKDIDGYEVLIPLFKEKLLACYQKTETQNTKEFKKLGNYSQKKGFYFEETKESIKAIKELCEEFFSKKENANAYRKAAEKKMQARERSQNKLFLKDDKPEPASPGCLSVAITNMRNNGKNICLIGLSTIVPNSRNGLAKAIRNTIRELNQQNGTFHYVLMDKVSKKFSQYFNRQFVGGILENGLAGANSRGAFCFEDEFVSFLGKIIFNEPNVQILGLTNVLFAPFKDKALNLPSNIPLRATESVNSYIYDYIQIKNGIGKNIFLPQITCCHKCQQMKLGAFSMLMTAKELGEKFDLQRKIQQKTLEQTEKNSLISCKGTFFDTLNQTCPSPLVLSNESANALEKGLLHVKARSNK